MSDYDKQHLPGCRKLIYDPKSSPCTCLLEYGRLVFDLNEANARIELLTNSMELRMLVDQDLQPE